MLICRSNHWTGFYKIMTSFMKKLVMFLNMNFTARISFSKVQILRIIGLSLQPFFFFIFPFVQGFEISTFSY